MRNATTTGPAAALMVLAACGGGAGDGAPRRSDPEASAANAAALEAVWSSEGAQAFLRLAYDINIAVGADPALRPANAGTLPVVRQPGSADARRAATESHARTLAGFLTGRSAPGRSAVLLPARHLGTTWTWSPRTSSYVVGARAAPDDRIRFVLYAPGAGPRGLAEPLAPIGHVDLVERSSGATGAVQVVVVAGGTTVMDYRLSATGGAGGGDVDVLGYVTDGVERLQFDLRNTVGRTPAGVSLTSDNTLELARRDVVLHYEVVSEANGERRATIGRADAEDSLSAGDREQVWNYGFEMVDALTLPIGAFFTL